jgi:capsular exopolysaccharide synthesis family protein
MNPEFPDVTKIMLAGLVLGCGVGFGLAFVLEQSYQVFRRPEDIESLLGIPVLASIPDFKLAYSGDSPRFLQNPLGGTTGSVGLHNAQSLLPGKVETATNQARETVGKGDARVHSNKKKNGTDVISSRIKGELNLVSRWKPTSIVAEQFRVAATRIVLSYARQKGAVIVITSAVTGEGKSSTAGNLGYVLAKDVGKSIVLIDGDMKRPRLSAYTGVPSEPGLSQVIEGVLPVEACLHQVGKFPLKVLPSGQDKGQPSDLRKMQKLEEIIAVLREQFDFVILDAPPILALADMTLLAAMADLIVLVVRAGQTPHELVEKALKSIKRQCEKGVILTETDENYVASSYRGYAKAESRSYFS